jgi:hypothetical protein
MFCARHHARARRTLLHTAVAIGASLGTGCSSERIVQPPNDGDVALSGLPSPNLENTLGAPVAIEFDTYEHSRQVVHPSAVAFPSAWHGQRFWLALTPYPNSDSRVENPSLFNSGTGDEWGIPAGVTNPVARTNRGYLSDPDLSYDPAADELRLYYREVMESHRGHKKPRHEADVLYVTRSSNGVQWSASQPVLNTVGRYTVSPTVTRRSDGDWKLWTVDAGRAGCNAPETRIALRRSRDGLGWGGPTRASFVQPGYLPWHLDVQYVPQLGSYWALVAAFPRGMNCTRTSLFLATSSDGVNWTTYPTPVLARGALSQFSTNVYRSTFAFDPSGRTLTIWLTGATTVRQSDAKAPPTLKWSAAVWHTSTQALLAHVSTASETPRVVADTQPSFLRRLAIENALP